jgi:tetratricopeptide (TPR) repeat protein
VLDHRTDIYSLGATLYELFSLQPPFTGRDRQELLRQITFEEPRPLRRVNRAIPADLETILLKALAKDPAGRYATAQEFADDLRRFLKDEAIRARRPSLLQKAVKWSRRHRAVVTSTVLMALVGLAISTLMFWRGQVQTEVMRQRAENRSGLAREAVDAMYLQAQRWLEYEPTLQVDGGDEKQQAFLEKALTFYKEFAQERGSDPSVRHKTADAYRQIADIQYRLGHWKEAEQATDQAIALLDQLTAEFPEGTDYRFELADCLITRGRVLQATGREAEARGVLQRSRACLEKLAADSPGTPVYRYKLGLCRYRLGDILSQQPGRLKEADGEYLEAQELFTKLLDDTRQKPTPERIDWSNQLAALYSHRGAIMVYLGRSKEGEQVLREGIARLEALAADSQLLPDFRHELGRAQYTLGLLLANAHRPSEAEALYRKALAVHERLVDTYPKVPRYQSVLAEILNNLAALLADQGNLTSARALAERAIRVQNAALVMSQNNTYRFYLQIHYRALGNIALRLHDHRGAAEAADGLATILPGCPFGGADSVGLLARCAGQAEQDAQLRPEERGAAIEQYVTRARQLVPEIIRNGEGMHAWFALNNLAWVLATSPATRFRDPSQAVAVAEKLVAREPRQSMYWNTLGVAYYRHGDWKKALTALKQATELNGGKDSHDWFFVAMAHWQLGEEDAARQAFARAVKCMKNKPAADDREELERFRAEAAQLLGVEKQVTTAVGVPRAETAGQTERPDSR